MATQRISEETLKQIKEEEAIFHESYIREGVTNDNFIEAVAKKMDEEKQSFIPAVYQSFDIFLEREKEITGITLACKEGCSYCCSSTMLVCTEPEVDFIIRFIGGLPREKRTPLVKKIREYLKDWEKFYTENYLILVTNPMRCYTDWKRPCVFLNEKNSCCEIYLARIIDCRTYTSLIPCTPENKLMMPCSLYYPGPGRMRFKSESWANNLILEELGGGPGVSKLKSVVATPLYVWLLLKKKDLNQFASGYR